MSPLHRHARALLLLLPLWGCDGQAPAPTAVPGGQPNVLLISIDTLRPDHLGCYGYERDTSPALDALAAAGTLFGDVTSASPWTLPSHTTLLTGLYPSRHGVKGHETRLGKQTRTLATRLREQGYQTLALVNSHNLSKRYGLGQGFESFEYIHEWSDDNTRIMNRGEQLVDTAIGLLEQRREAPFFLFVHTYDVHTDWTPRPEYREQFVRPYDGSLDGTTSQLVELRNRDGRLNEADKRFLFDLYDAEIRQFDDELARLFSRLEELGLEDDTLVIVTSDHGEEFGEHDSVLHGRTHYEEVIRIPLVMRGPGVPAGERVEHPVHLVDVAPTILAACDVPDATLDGLDLRTLFGSAPAPDRYLYSEADHNNAAPDIRRMVRFRQHKLLFDLHTDEAQLFDLAADPAEQLDLSAQEAELAALLLERLELFMTGEATADSISMPSEEEQRRLRALGYLGDEE